MRETAGTNPEIPISQPIFSVVFLALISLIFIWVSGDWLWAEGWIFIGIFFIASLAALLRMYFKDPALFRERFSPPIQSDQRSWDKIVIFLVMISWVIWYIVMPLDARRYGWSPEFPVWLKIVGFVVTALGFWLFYETFRENTFAAPVVKMQEARKQKEISSGLYGIVRHPLYAGATLMVIGAPLLVSSVFGLIAGSVLTLTLAIRSVGEEMMLKEDLPGYGEYMKHVRWRFIPFVF